MSYGTKYYIEFKNHFDLLIRVNLDFIDYSGDATELKSKEDSGEISQTEEQWNLFKPVRGSEFSIDLLSITDFALIDLYVTGKRDCKVTVTKDSNIIWVGWLVPNQYNESYISAPYFVTISANDGLGELKTYIWNTDYDAVSPLVLLYGSILSKTDLDLKFTEAVNVYDSYMTTELDDTPLNQCAFPTKKYLGMTYYDILADICTGLGAEIQQVNGEWRMVRIMEQKDELKLRTFDFVNMSPIVASTENPLKLIGLSQLNKLTGQSHELSINPGVNAMRFRHLMDRRFIFETPEFDDFVVSGTGKIANGWSSTYGMDVDIGVIDNKMMQHSTDFNTYSNPTAKYIFQKVDNFTYDASLGSDNLRMSLSLKVGIAKTGGDVLADQRISIKISDGVDTYWLDADGIWQASNTYILLENIEIKDTKDIEFKTVEITNISLPFDGDLTININAPYQTSGTGTLSDWYISKCSGEIYNKLFGIYDDYLFLKLTPPIPYNTGVNFNMTYIPQFETEFKFGEFSSLPNSPAFSWNGLYRSFLPPLIPTAREWSQRGVSATTYLSGLVWDEYTNYFSQSKWVLRGSILTDSIYFNNTIVDYNVNVKKYYCKGGSYNLRNSVFNGIFHEIGAYESADWILITGAWIDNNIWIDSELWKDN